MYGSKRFYTVRDPEVPQMIERTAGGAMLGTIVLVEKCLAAASALLSAGTAIELMRSRS